MNDWLKEMKEGMSDWIEEVKLLIKNKGEITMPDLEKATESCGVMFVLEGSVQTTINLHATKEEVMEAIQAHLLTDNKDLLKFKTATEDAEEYCLFDPRRILLAVFKKEFVIQSKIQPVQVIPGSPPGGNAGQGRR